MHFWFNVKKGKQAWLIELCMMKIAIFPESFFDSNSVDIDPQIGGLTPLSLANNMTPAKLDPHPHHRKEKVDKDKAALERERLEREEVIINVEELKDEKESKESKKEDNGDIDLDPVSLVRSGEKRREGQIWRGPWIKLP